MKKKSEIRSFSKFFFWVFVLLLFNQGCQIKDKTTHRNNENFLKFYGIAATYKIGGLSLLGSESNPEGLLVFASEQLLTSEKYHILQVGLDGRKVKTMSFSVKLPVKIDLNGNRNLTDDFISPNSLRPTKIVKMGNGYVAVGTATFDNANVGIDNLRLITVHHLDNNLNLLENRDTLITESGNLLNPGNDIIANDVINLSDTSFIIVGAKEITRGNSKDMDSYAFIYNDKNIFIKDRNYGIPNKIDEFKIGFITGENSATFIGSTPNAGIDGAQGVNVRILETSLVPKATPQPLQNFTYGVPGESGVAAFDEEVQGASKTEGGVVIVGTSIISETLTKAFMMNISLKSGKLYADTIPGDITSSTQGFDVAQTRTNEYAIIGVYKGFFDIEGVSKNDEMMYLTVNSSGIPTGVQRNFGLRDGNDVGNKILLLPNGKIVLAGIADFGAGSRLICLIKINQDATLAR